MTLTLRFRTGVLEPFNDDLSELSHGALQAEFVERDETTIMPLTAESTDGDVTPKS